MYENNNKFEIRRRYTRSSWQLCKGTWTPRTFLIEKAITAYFDELDELIADQRIAEITGGSKNLIPLEEVQKKTGINV